MEEKKERKSWRDIVSSRNPDLDLEDDLAVGEFLDDSFKRYDDSESQRENLNKVLAEDSRAAGILTGLASGMDENGEPFSLVEYLITNYGDDIREAATTEEAIKKAKEKEAARIKEAADEEKRKRDAEEKLRKTDEALTEAVRQVNVDEANVVSMLEWLYGTQDTDGIIHKIIRHELDAEDWKRIIHAFNMDMEIEAAREEGRKQGRTARPGAIHRNLAEKAPTDLGGGGNGGCLLYTSEAADEKRGGDLGGRLITKKRRHLNTTGANTHVSTISTQLT